MRRVIYSPENGDMKEAQELAKTLNLQIQIGDSANTCNLKFDRDKTQVLNVPTEHEITALTKCMVGETIWVNAVSDWFNFLKHNVVAYVQEKNNIKKITPQIKEQHYLRFVHTPLEKGKYVFSIYVDSEEIFSSETLVV